MEFIDVQNSLKTHVPVRSVFAIPTSGLTSLGAKF